MTIITNGSKWHGDSVDSVETLLEVLGCEPLDPSFEEYGNFAYADPISATTDKPLFPKGTVRFFGNFYKLSHVFNIDTDDSDVIGSLTAAIRANQQTDAYKQAKLDIASRKVREQEESERRTSKYIEELERVQYARLQRKFATQS